MKHQPTIAVITTSGHITQARQLAQSLKLHFLADSQGSSDYDYLLVYEHGHLGLQKNNENNRKIFFLDFLAPALSFRRRHTSLRKELLARALGCTPSQKPFIIDTTAGFGKDSFILAALGFEVTLIERSLIVHALLQDALKRAEKVPDLAPILHRLHLVRSDAKTYLLQLQAERRPQVIYLDPMFPTRQKSALAKKEMVILKALLGGEQDADELFKVAISCATHRVVVKRPRLAVTISSEKPNFSLLGRSSRFDIYLK